MTRKGSRGEDSFAVCAENEFVAEFETRDETAGDSGPARDARSSMDAHNSASFFCFTEVIVCPQDLDRELSAEGLALELDIGVVGSELVEPAALLSVAGFGFRRDFGVGGLFFADAAFRGFELLHEREGLVFQFALTTPEHLFVPVQIRQFLGIGDASAVEPVTDLLELVGQAAGFKFEGAQF